MVKTRSTKKTSASDVEQGQSSTVHHGSPGIPSSSVIAKTTGVPSSAASSVSGSSATIRSRTLEIEADYAQKIAILERATLERERIVLERERAALELRKEAQIAALEERGSVRSSRRSKSYISNREVRKWLDTCLDTAITTIDVDLQPQNVNINVPCSESAINKINRSAAIPAPLQTRNSTYTMPATNSQNVLRPVLKEHMTNDLIISRSPARPICSSTTIKPISSIEKSPSDITLLAQAITSLSNNNKHKTFGDGRLPVFDGKPLDWLTFKRVYDSTQAAYSASDNLTRIGMALRGAAQDSVAVLLVSARDPIEVIQALALRFGRAELIVLQEVASIRSLPKVNTDSSDLHKFSCRVRNSVEVMRLLEQRPYLESPELFQSVLSKLTPLLRTRWADYAATHFTQRTTKLELLASFLAQEVDLQLKFGLLNEPINYPKKADKVHTVNTYKPSTSTAPYIYQSENHEKSSNPISNNKKICLFCNNEHSLSHCCDFKTLSVDDRWKFVKGKKLCHKCLKKGLHNYKNCDISKEICTNEKCNSRHHKLLHIAYVVENEDEQGESSSTPHSGELKSSDESSSKETTDFVAHASSSFSPSNNNKHPNYRPFLKIIAVTISGPRGSINTHALLDDGSTSTFIDSELAAQIGARGPCVQTHLKCVGGLSKYTKMEYVNFNIKGCHTDEIHQVRQARSIKDLQLARQSIYPKNINEFSYLSDLVPFLCYDDAQPKIVIGIDNWHLTIPQCVRNGTKSQPAAIRTALGWVLFGFRSSRTSPVDIVNHVLFDESDFPSTDNSSLENLIKNYYRLDSIGISKKEPRSTADACAIEILERTANRLPCGRFEVGLLWKPDNPIIPNSYSLALSRFLSLEKKMISDPGYAERYRQNIHDLVSKDYAEICQNEPSSNSVCWFLPHFGVVNPNKPAKLRVVHDAAAKIKGVSLNSLLLTGPDLLQSLFDILLRFREGKVAMTADIKEMFPRFKIIKQDRDAQRFLWRDNPNVPITTYRMSSMIFGAVSSPFTAIYMKNKNALEVKDQYPEAVHGIVYDTYMDDYIGSVDSSDRAAQLAVDIVHVHARAGLEMRGWVSNDPNALRLLPKHLLSESVSDINIDLANLPSLSPCVRALGLYWHPSRDLIGFNTPIKQGQETLPNPLTKRVILSLIMRVFDPLGILAPIVIRGRILLQNAWRMNLDWDIELPNSETIAWNNWFQDLITTAKIKIPRCYNHHFLQPSQTELHVFADASAQAYGAVAYWRFTYSNGDVQLALVCSKSRVAPLKPSSIPRLELQAALIAARLATTIVEAVKFKPIKRTFWCDSMNVLGWLRNDSRSYKTFVAHRVGEIIELTDERDDSEIEMKSLFDKYVALKGELVNINVFCEDLRVDRDRLQEIVNEYDHCRDTYESNLQRITHLERHLKEAQAHSESMLEHKRQCNNIRSTLNSDDLLLAENHVLRRSQLDSFSQEIKSITIGIPVSHRSRLSKLPAVIDKNNILRLSTRIVAASDINEDMKSPILLDGKHPTVRLLVLHYHRKAAHANTEMVVNELRQRYWILNLRSTVRSVAFNCQFCKVRRSVTYQPTMGNLPTARLAHHCRPFSFVGLDYFGPVTVAVGRRREKRYVALFTCLSVRAIHLEIVHSLSSDAAIMALRRFIARRGTPSEIHSDNGTSFVGANRELRALYSEVTSNFAAGEMIKWKFIPPSAPFMGGSWERLVRSVKTALKVTLGNNIRSPTDEVFSTLLCEAEALVNSRPLTHVACDPQYPEALTPSHFLLGYSSGRPIPANLTDSDICSRAGWRRALRMADHFWKRWITEYLPTLSPRKFVGKVPQVSIGDIVIVVDGTLPRGTWPKGRITAMYPETEFQGHEQALPSSYWLKPQGLPLQLIAGATGVREHSATAPATVIHLNRRATTLQEK
ncbi:uncharacterized protein LOC131851643 [Achroia grisella]|uniref:uncharacterized protein LOC131851643 n=1 Tax=Achroia grisella TaxID=688607 RepID=UPI0027D32172|nr:uncharacterized protein LOC131851643 [Achroia grisella]